MGREKPRCCLRYKLIANQIDRDAGSDWPKDERRYDAFFKIPGENAVFELNSVGLPEEESTSGLFLYVFAPDKYRRINQLVGIQTAKAPNLISRDRAMKLSDYTPAQLHDMAAIVRIGEPISPKEYRDFNHHR